MKPVNTHNIKPEHLETWDPCLQAYGRVPNDPTLAPSALMALDTAEEIETYDLLPWYRFVPVAIEIGTDTEASSYVTRHYLDDEGYGTPRERIEWRYDMLQNDEPNDSGHRVLILEDGVPWVTFVIHDMREALRAWAKWHKCMCD